MNEYISLTPYPFSLSKSEGFFSASDSFIKEPAFTIKNESSFNGYDLSIPDSYFLEISSSGIMIAAASDSGIFYAEQTVKQLLMTYKNKVPCLKIYDKPEYKWRGFLLDCCRSFYSTEFIKKMLDLLAFHKMNVFHWHLTDDQGWRINIPEYPLLTEVGSKRKAPTMPESEDGDYEEVKPEHRFYTDKEVAEIVDYASKLHITIIPEVELPGHSSALLAAYPELGCTKGPYNVEQRWGVFDDVICAGNDKIFDLYDAVFKTFARLFPGKYIHIGGDECPKTRWEKCPACQARLKKENLKNTNQLQSWVTSRMTSLVLKYNKIPVGWDEVLENTDIIPLPQELVVQSWRGAEGGEKAVSLNHNVIMSPLTHCYLNFKNIKSYEEPGRLGVITLEKAYTFSPFTDKMSKSSRTYILGGECNLWSEALPSSKVAEYLIFPRLCAISECLWLSEEKKDYNRFLNNLNDHKKRLSDLKVLYFE